MIRLAKECELPRLMEIFAVAKDYMRRTGNPSQWGDEYPSEEFLRGDIRKGELYVVEDEGVIHGCFVLAEGEDPTYATIDGAWHSEGSYGTIHRVASDGTGGVFAAAMDFAKARHHMLRIDTHEDNATMHHLVQKHGFRRCGIIFLEGYGGPRVAYDWCKAD